MSARVAVSVAECMYGKYGGEMDDDWRGSWEVVSGLPPSVAASGSLREVRTGRAAWHEQHAVC